ncbi:unnamed protein product, partial [Vitis vinifera]|uniref:GDSL esterase/lipase 7 n=1 Tax=Vitis vinifera TaxID=29760 RepID=D7SML7_VITVI
MDLLLSLFCSIIFLHFLSVNSRDSPPLAPALYVFGDSLFDSGNNNLLPTLTRANYLPYGVNFPGGVTGRFTNGRTVADFIAEYLGLPYPPPSISIHGTVLTGLNYASGSCGILPETRNKLIGTSVRNMQFHFHWLFKMTLKQNLEKEYGSKKELSAYLSRSIFVFSIGNNDYLNNYLQPHQYNSSHRYTPQQFAQLLVDSQGLKSLYNLGAWKLVVFELGPLGCLPSTIRKSRSGGKCAEETNALISYFNNGVGAMLKNLTSTLSGSTFIFSQVNWLAYDAMVNPSEYGLKDTRNPCCTTWLNGTLSSIPFLEPYPNRSEYFFWDAFHITEAACSLIAARCITGSSACVPMNIKALVQI